MIKLYEEYIDSTKGKIVEVKYKIIHTDYDGKPVTLITDFKMVEVKDNSIVVIAKGYQYGYLSKYGWSGYQDRKKKGWVAFDDMNSERKIMREYQKKDFQDGVKKIKVYEIQAS